MNEKDLHSFLDSLLISRYEETNQHDRDDTAIGVSIGIGTVSHKDFEYLKEIINDKSAWKYGVDILGEDRMKDAASVKNWIHTFIDLLREVFPLPDDDSKEEAE